ncbi:MAG: hypothetical protein RR412_00620 [Burkholderiaceae bacterium]
MSVQHQRAEQALVAAMGSRSALGLAPCSALRLAVERTRIDPVAPRNFRFDRECAARGDDDEQGLRSEADEAVSHQRFALGALRIEFDADIDSREHHRVREGCAADQAKLSNFAPVHEKLLRVKCVVGDNARNCVGSITSRSNTELTTDSRPRPIDANNKTKTSCGTTSSLKSQALSGSSTRFFPLEHPSAAIFAALSAHACDGLRRAEFISVSGQCAARSALSSDQRIKTLFWGCRGDRASACADE